MNPTAGKYVIFFKAPMEMKISFIFKVEGRIFHYKITYRFTHLECGGSANLSLVFHFETIFFLSLKKTPEQIWLVCPFFSHSNQLRTPPFLSDLHTAVPHIVTRPWPNWFLFSFNIPLELAFLSTPWNKTSKRRRKKRQSPHSAGGTKVSWEGPKKFLFEATERSK